MKVVAGGRVVAQFNAYNTPPSLYMDVPFPVEFADIPHALLCELFGYVSLTGYLEQVPASVTVARLPRKYDAVRVCVAPEAIHWMRPWNIDSYYDVLYEEAQKRGFSCYFRSFERIDGLYWDVPADGAARSGFLFSDAWSIARDLVLDADRQLGAALTQNTLVQQFRFPTHIATVCAQYLEYFVQFLRDLGIEAQTHVQQRARDVLFTITPNEGSQALDRIREALDVYLGLPGSPDFSAAAAEQPTIAVQQLQANVYHLQSQLAIAGAMLQARAAENEYLQLTNYCFRQMLASENSALRPPSGAEDNSEPLIPGLLDVTPLEVTGLRFDLPGILRWLKKLKRRS